jgi:hypothetical protein
VESSALKDTPVAIVVTSAYAPAEPGAGGGSECPVAAT